MVCRDLPKQLLEKIDSLKKAVAPHLPTTEIALPNKPIFEIKPIIREISTSYRMQEIGTMVPHSFSLQYYYQSSRGALTQLNIEWESLSRPLQLLLTNISSWAKQTSWEHLFNTLTAGTDVEVKPTRNHKVFISYKKLGESEKVADNIAHRLSQMGMETWYDQWEIKAGDSLVGKLGEGFRNTDACLLILDGKYNASEWCTKELNTSLTKAITENIIVIPILAEKCEVPELVKELKRIDLIEPKPDEFERKLTEITDAIYRVDLNPYR